MSSMGMYGNSMPMYGMSNGMFYGMNTNLSTADQGKGKSREADFEAAFAQVAASLQEQTSRIEEVKDDVEGINEAMEKTRLDDEEVSEMEMDFKKYAFAFLHGETTINKSVQILGRTTSIGAPTSAGGHGKMGSPIQPAYECTAG